MKTMLPDFLDTTCVPLPSNASACLVVADAYHWSWAADALHALGASLLALWGSDDRDRDERLRIRAAYLLPDRIVVVEHAMPAERAVYPSLTSRFPVADRMQRAVHDLLGIRADGGDTRAWLRHGGWPERVFPLRRDVGAAQTYPLVSAAYPFVPVDGDGVHEVAVGPVHAGIIEPGRFHVAVVGEKVLRLEERLGYTHKGVAKRFEALAQRDGHRLAARVSGDSTVAFGWAYCAALESLTGTVPSPRAAALRALALERERIANHLGDLGGIGNDAGLAFGLTQFSSLKEQLLRHNAEVFGQRYLFDLVVPGGVARDLPAHSIPTLIEEIAALERAVRELRGIYAHHEGVQDRFLGTGRLTLEQARRLGAIGLAARASGVPRDLRLDQPWAPYDQCPPVLATRPEGDVAARVQVRFDETLDSLRLCRQLLDSLPPGALAVDVPAAPAGQWGLGLVEGWRGPVMVALETGPEGSIRRCHPHDPSWQNWPLIEVAMLGNIIPDFPLINKSFNLSYSGHDG
ncbi:NADH-quinone oxidoreductase subunit C [Rhodanobacter ginsengisoli]|uniref:NADH-quinone oxidoreductase subunit C n=1 Tax=Rhodanobacter ginsengisoli TaxID=418646 RepID=A0ABW0QQF2_9GAMM